MKERQYIIWAAITDRVSIPQLLQQGYTRRDIVSLHVSGLIDATRLLQRK
jgi:hypothetical protein